MSSFQDNNLNILFECPHCYENITLNQIEIKNNTIYKHGILKSNGKWINPFMSNLLCNRYLNNKKISGCGKNFKITYDDNEYKIMKYMSKY